MSDCMRSMPFAQLMDWILTEYRNQGSIFGVSKLVRYDGGRARPIFQERIEAPYGPAAGPHTQLAQNIVAAYAAGSRFFEVKTVQVMDGPELAKCVSKPCIAAEDECYNCEWSTELYVPQALDEYIKAWFACKLLARELELGDPDGFVFHMSVGYDLAGIQSEKIDSYLNAMMDASGTESWRACVDWTLAHLDRFQRVDRSYIEGISPNVSRSVTESTLHGCPPEEIERIAAYLLTEKGLHTYVKCNPTMLGYDLARRRLDSLGFDYVSFGDRHFREDLQFEDAVPMLRRLMALAEERGLAFGVKLTNTCPVDVTAGELPSQEMYLSGRALYPLSLSLAQKLSHAFGGKLPISYSGGADIATAKGLVDAGIWPVTMATTVLKPGGYQRLSQIGRALMDGDAAPWTQVDLPKLDVLVSDLDHNPHFRKPVKPIPSKKLDQKVPLLDCFTAPCRVGCPIGQDIPAYLRRVQAGEYEKALEIILQRNPLPFMTGTLCNHRCQGKCMRGHYDEPVYIRAAKLAAAQGGFDALLPRLRAKAPQAGMKVAVVGGGPAGLSAAFFLAREGVDVTVLEQKQALGGIVRHVIPAFRIGQAAIDSDVALCRVMGTKFRLGTQVKDLQTLREEGFTHIILATGAWAAGDAGLEYGQAVNVISFLERAKADPDSLKPGAQVAVIGGGNTAMDAARVAKRLPGVEQVSLIYRRTRRYMPADEEELELALAEGVSFRELLAPVGYRDGSLICRKMALGAPDASGRRSPVDTGEVVEIPASTVIAAVGERVDSALYRACGLALDSRGKPQVDPDTLESSVPGVYVIGDGQKGPGTVVEAIAGAAKAARSIAGLDAETFVQDNIHPDYQKPLSKRGDVCTDCANCSDTRCLGCATVCATCTEVCPNRANVAVWTADTRQQILHVDGMCNECGNCATFCPYDSRPYRDKFTLFWSEAGFTDSENEGFLPLAGSKIRVRLAGQVTDYDLDDPACGLFPDLRALIQAVYTHYSYLLGGNSGK